jgi:hypothetical protein
MTDIDRQALRNQSARALLWLSGILVLLGLVVISPAGRMFFFTTAAICAGTSALLYRGATRTIGIFVTLVTLFLVGASYPSYKKHMDLYLERAEEVSAIGLEPHSTDDKAVAPNALSSYKSPEQPGHE